MLFRFSVVYVQGKIISLGVSLKGQAIRYNLFSHKKKWLKRIFTTILNAKYNCR